MNKNVLAKDKTRKARIIFITYLLIALVVVVFITAISIIDEISHYNTAYGKDHEHYVMCYDDYYYDDYWKDKANGGLIESKMDCLQLKYENAFSYSLDILLIVPFIGFLHSAAYVRRITTPKKKMSSNLLILIFSIMMVVCIAIVMIGVINDIMWLGCIGLLGACATFIFAQRAWRTKRYRKMSDKRLIELFQEYATNIQTSLSVANGLTGIGSRLATDKVNMDIQNYREKGELIGAVLEERGYTVNYSVLTGKVSKGKSQSSVIKGAVIGGIVAGNVGTVIGAVHEMNKNNKK